MSRIYLKEMNWQSCFYPGKSSSTTDEQGCADGVTRPTLGKNGNASYTPGVWTVPQTTWFAL
jgi:hypothetical protein